MNTAIIVAAGSGQRFGSQPKQFANLLGKPIIIHTLERFAACPKIDEIVLVLSDDGREYFDRIINQFEISNLRSIIGGGKTRAESVKKGLDSIAANADDIVAIHDGARPLVSVDEITRTVEKATQTGAACLVVDVTDTIKEIDGEHILRTIDRSKLRRAVTPQAFRYDILKRAFKGVDLTESITDECYLVERLDVKIAWVKGNSRNIKITRPEDLLFAELTIEKEKAVSE
ncbi:MAG: 2-C-methyl-D-erythritol 4-phosphate cytidylyltransferase [Pyrinomonadaceae bacterium]